MEKKTILAVVLSTIVLIASFLIQGYFFPKPPPGSASQHQTSVTAVETNPESDPVRQELEQILSTPAREEITQDVSQQEAALVEANIQLEYVTIETELFTVVLTNAGGDMVSLKWKDSRNNKDVDLILSGSNEARAFSVAFGGLDAQPITSNFNVRHISDYSVEFYRDFSVPAVVYGTDGKFRLIKRYEFKPSDYMFELRVILDGGFSVQSFNFSGSAYTLSFGPQIGPLFEKLDNYYDYRHYHTFINGKRKNAKANEIIDSRPSWAAISGKYFSLIAIPYLAQYSLQFSERHEPGIISASRLNIVRPAANISKVEDTYLFYLGPKTQEILTNYNTGKNEFGIKDSGLVEAASSRGILSPLEKLLKWLLMGFHKVVPNYGVAIIFLTLLIKILFFPLTKKGSEATLRMQALAPKIKELQEKYKGNPQKLNQEMGNFYKQEGYNPLSGCLPMLLQLPIFIAMYQLFNNHFDLRGAEFIPGWIPDLSLPEFIWKFPGDFKLPFLGWTALRALPFIYVGSQLLYGKVTQMPGQQSNTQMKMMLYVMPIVFFFVLYNVPSGLLIYWIFSNLLTLAQQLIINKYVIKKKAAQAEAQAAQQPQPPQTKIAPGGGKKKKKH
ncbi:MAG: membrane protein insertase YidC [Treponema sp.]|nr:membrane protein insertase YidC [Treponema sp.]